MESCIYQGRVRHRRYAPRPHEFSYRLFMMYLDLTELDELFRNRWLWSARRPALAWLRRGDHLGDPGLSLDTAVRDLVQAKTARRPEGPVRLLTHLRYFGYGFNPVSFYYCYDAAGTRPETIVAEVNNTPWGEQHCYVLGESLNEGGEGHKRFRFGKRFHVSPFLPMDIAYDWRFSTPGARLAVHLEDHKAGEKVFDATLAMERRELSGGTLAAALLRFPFMTGRVITAIYWQALRLWLKGTPFYPHPGTSEAGVAETYRRELEDPGQPPSGERKRTRN